MRTLIRSSSVSSDNPHNIGSLPINSGIRPYFIRDSGFSNGSGANCFGDATVIKPIDLFCAISNSPSKAPPQMNNTFDVLKVTLSA